MSFKNRVFLGKLPHDTKRRDIERWLEDYGFKHVENVQMKAGYAFVRFTRCRRLRERPRDRDRDRNHDRDRNRVRDDDERNFQSRGRFTYRNGYYRDKYGAPYNTEWRLTVENLSSRVGWQEVKDFFRRAGNVTYAECHRQRTGEGAIEFSSYEDLKRAIDKLDGEEFMGRHIKLTDISGPAATKSETRRSPNTRERVSRRQKSRSRDYSRARSRSVS
ncbi:hypothetical protein MXB_3489 [Myxobolus squamalis]|nr:hypothetical protein MXB_3489 [Myxobolus squamalis]